MIVFRILLFFRFCEELLIKYRNDQRIMMISGMNYLGKWKSEIQSYHFSYIPSIWGWASWRRAWAYYDIDVRLWGEPEVQNAIKHTLCDNEQFNFWRKIFDGIYNDKNHILWDCSWVFYRLLYSGLSVVPSVNLISYIGFVEGAAWNLDSTHPFVKLLSNLPLYSVSFPLQHPYGITDDRDFTRTSHLKTLKTLGSPHGNRLKNVLVKLLRFSRLYGLAVIVARPLYWLLASRRIRRRQKHARKLKG